MRKLASPWGRGCWQMGGAMCAALLLAGGCAKTPAALPPVDPTTQADPAASSAPYQIGPGDTLEVLVWREEQLSGPVQVRSDGMATIALVGDVRAAGQTPEALAADIRTGLARFVDEPHVVVRVAAPLSRRFYIVGQVRGPGMYELRANQTYLQALAVAGGFTDFADRDDVRIIRRSGAGATIEPDYDAIVEGEAPDPLIEPGDTIVVP